LIFSWFLGRLNSSKSNQLRVSAEVVNQIRQPDHAFSAFHADTSQENPIHRVLHEPEHMLDQCTNFRLLPIVPTLRLA
jgi:hypothetical protein